MERHRCSRPFRSRLGHGFWPLGFHCQCRPKTGALLGLSWIPKGPAIVIWLATSGPRTRGPPIHHGTKIFCGFLCCPLSIQSFVKNDCNECPCRWWTKNQTRRSAVRPCTWALNLIGRLSFFCDRPDRLGWRQRTWIVFWCLECRCRTKLQRRPTVGRWSNVNFLTTFHFPPWGFHCRQVPWTVVQSSWPFSIPWNWICWINTIGAVRSSPSPGSAP